MRSRYNQDLHLSIQDDISLLSSGYVLIIFYVSVVLGNFTRMNIKVCIQLYHLCEVRFQICKTQV